MKKLLYAFILCFITIILITCSQSNNKITSEVHNDYIAIVCGDKTYVPFCPIDNNERGNQIGIVDKDKGHQVYEYKNHSTDKWLISFYNIEDTTTSILMKEINVTAIPDNLKSDYHWNKK